MSQDAFGKKFGRDHQTFARWEAALHTPVPKGADALMRQLYLEREGARPLFTHIVDKLETAATNAAKEPAVFFHEKADGTWGAGAETRAKSFL